MRALAYILILVGVSLLILAGRQQYSGITDNPVLVGSTPAVSGGEISRIRDPEGFRRAMSFHGLYAGMIAGLGVALLLVVRSQDRFDPLAVDRGSEDGVET